MQFERIAAKGQIVPLLFMENAMAASQTDAQMSLVETAATSGTTDNDEYTMPWPGEVVAISFEASAAGTAGSATLGASINGTEDADTTLTVTTATSGYKRVPRGKAKFSAGAKIGLELTTGATWAPVTTDFAVQVWVLLHVEGI